MPPYANHEQETQVDLASEGISNELDDMMIDAAELQKQQQQENEEDLSASTPTSCNMQQQSQEEEPERRDTQEQRQVRFAMYSRLHRIERVSEEDKALVWFTSEERCEMMERPEPTPWELYWEEYYATHGVEDNDFDDSDDEEWMKQDKSICSKTSNALSLPSACRGAYAAASMVFRTTYLSLLSDDM